ncbi:C6 zinc finger domain-containing protein [Rutstroemia sp. NJR-2017a BVV2]|nr:C6 zinc finger domain-containing protein [Rutstroemia sp. NJR-2017a BVV2]
MGVGPDGRPRPMAVPQGTQLYGAHGQPLSIPTATQPAPMGSPYSDYAMPSPTNSYNSFTEEGNGDGSRKRPQPEPHPSILPPPIPGQPTYTRGESAGRRPAVEDDLRLPPVTPNSTAQATSNYSPGSSTSSHSNLQPPSQGGLPSLSRTPPPRSSPGESRIDPMSLGSIMERRADTEIDRSMLGKLDRRG